VFRVKCLQPFLTSEVQHVRNCTNTLLITASNFLTMRIENEYGMPNVYESKDILCILVDKSKDTRHKIQDNKCKHLYLNLPYH
jgi:hypothetical protein